MTLRHVWYKIQLVILAVFLMALHPLSIAADIGEEVISPWAMCQLKTAIHDYFKLDLEENIQINLLTGGYGATSIRLDIADKNYVLRVINEQESPERINTEIFAMKNAAEIGVAPAIHWISDNGHAILMDYIPGKTLSMECGKRLEVMAKVADLLRQVHALPKNTFNAPSFSEHMEQFYRKYSTKSSDPAIWDIAISIIREGAALLQELDSPSVNTHGDLNPRNILISSQGLYFIDWSEEMYTEPFHDLVYFSILMDYDSDDDAFLLKSYLQKSSSSNEKKRFLIAKKMNFGRLALGGLYIGDKLKSVTQGADDIPPQLEDWSYYAKAFANNDTPLTSQFFLDLAQVAIKSANAIDVSKPPEEICQKDF